MKQMVIPVFFTLGFGFALTTGGSVVYAATPADSCFAFTAGTGTITDYYDHEGNNATNPACPRAVDIPSEIGGVAVTALGTSAFGSNHLTAVTMPDTIVEIGPYAFSNNSLTAVTVPVSVMSIGNYAFYNNELKAITIQGDPATFGSYILFNNTLEEVSYNGTTYTDTTPNSERCFEFTAGTGTITKFHYAELAFIKANGEACLHTEVTIPATIGGVAVTAIGDSAFYAVRATSITMPDTVLAIGGNSFAYNPLKSVKLSNSLQSIGSTAFYFSQLESVTLPASLTSIGGWAFYGNHLTSVTIPDGVTSIGSEAFALNHIEAAIIGDGISSLNPWTFSMQADLAAWSNDWYAYENDYYGTEPSRVKAALDAIFYTRVYTADPSNPHNIKNGTITVDWVELDGDGNSDDLAVIGGHIVNPASLEVTYRNKAKQAVRVTKILTGWLNDNYLTNYFVNQGPSVPPVVDRDNPTSAEQQAIDEAFSAYYRVGDTVTVTPPTIDGYVTPLPQTVVLGATTNEATIVYSVTGEESGDGDSSSSVDVDESLAETGQSVVWFGLAGATLLSGGAMLILRRS